MLLIAVLPVSRDASSVARYCDIKPKAEDTMLMHHASKNETCHAEGCPGLLLWCIFNMAAVQHFCHSTKDFLTISLVQVASAWTAVAVSNYTLPGISLISSPAPSCQLFCFVYFVMCFIALRFKSRINFTVCLSLLIKTLVVLPS